MNPLFHTEFSISDSLKNVRKSVLIYETIIKNISLPKVYSLFRAWLYVFCDFCTILNGGDKDVVLVVYILF